ncbi:hypothetical protein DFQ01_112148 [Paenibacillus cellulosilyticus]|uniref:Uncharacterized protein n=1 Tax=Paenibacillus cellulosilyticus TaxID=375489 RepID=A0A2V2YUC0_9BACL|nr:hypothetical protein [Paenibacillus cellulosilyticus]PWW00795.1 hypothetical protein DFQ01_112148 [Paenibacillus cellulosilyticus]QKS45648.1 hypothetical protein HUB94_15295 [Paenibacillus cellulosilyticus]
MEPYTPLITAILTAFTTYIPFYMKDVIQSKKKNKQALTKERLEKCYTPLYLRLRSLTDMQPGNVREWLEPILAGHGYLISEALMNLYVQVANTKDRMMLISKEIDESNQTYEQAIQKLNDNKRPAYPATLVCHSLSYIADVLYLHHYIDLTNLRRPFSAEEREVRYFTVIKYLVRYRPGEQKCAYFGALFLCFWSFLRTKTRRNSNET